MGPNRTTAAARTPLDAMTAAAAVAPRRITPISCSKGWKRRLYRDCLDRTRRARAQGATTTLDRDMAYDLLRQHAIELQNVSSWHNGENDTICQTSSSSSREYLEIQESETSRMSIDNDCCNNDDNPLSLSHNDDELGVAHYITEEELFDLMKEVEDEIEREEMLRHEQIFNLDQLDRQSLQEQVAEFEEWQEQRTILAPPLCPVCYEETVLLQQQQQSLEYSAPASYRCVHCHHVLLPSLGVNGYNDMP
jgi:DNA-directed RNA polymerase subunit M/transcription elongation factor TFIIS